MADKPQKTPPPAPPTFKELHSPEFPVAAIAPNSRIRQVVESDLTILGFQSDRLKEAWSCSSPFDTDGVCKLMGMTFKLIEMRRRVMLLPMGALSEKERKGAEGSGYDSLYDD